MSNCLLSQLFSRFSSCSFRTSRLSIAALCGPWISCRGGCRRAGCSSQQRICSFFYPANMAFLEQATFKIDLTCLLEYLQQPEASWGHQQSCGRGAVPSAAEGAASLPEEVSWGGAVGSGADTAPGQPLTHLSSSHLPSSYRDAFEDFKEKSKKHTYYKPILIANINNCWNFR